MNIWQTEETEVGDHPGDRLDYLEPYQLLEWLKEIL